MSRPRRRKTALPRGGAAEPGGPPQRAPTAPPAAGEGSHCTGGPIAAPAPCTARLTPRTAGLRQAARAVLVAWDGNDGVRLAAALDELRAALPQQPRPRRQPGARRSPRQGTKQAAVLALLRRPEGASGPAIAAATGWAPHTVRGFLAGLKRKGVAVTVLERVRQVGPGKDGAKGSHTTYRVASAGEAG
jgi:hypothetical protein